MVAGSGISHETGEGVKKSMGKQKLFPGTIDHKTQLTQKEQDILGRAVMKVAQSILDRERNPTRRALLQARAKTEVAYQIGLCMTRSLAESQRSTKGGD